MKVSLSMSVNNTVIKKTTYFHVEIFLYMRTFTLPFDFTLFASVSEMDLSNCSSTFIAKIGFMWPDWISSSSASVSCIPILFVSLNHDAAHAYLLWR